MNRFELLRYERGLTRSEVAEASGVPERTVRSLEDGTTTRPNAPNAKALADFYGITVAELLGVEQKDAA